MNESLEVILIRHGRTAYNATGRIQGRIDNPLDELGMEQAERVGERLARDACEGALLIHSPLQRAVRTAEIIASVSGVVSDVSVDPNWIELDYGSFDGLHQSEVDPHTWSTWRANPEFRPPNGESLVDVENRVRVALNHVIEQGRRTVIVVSHVSPIKAAITVAMGVNTEVVWRTRLDTAAISRITFARGAWSMTGFNDTSHLGPPYVSHG